MSADKKERQMIRTADHVRHRPTGGEWVVAFVEEGRLYMCGWPLSSVPVGDCDLIKTASNIEYNSLVCDLAKMDDDSDPRCRFGKRILAREDMDKITGDVLADMPPLPRGD